MNKNGFVDYLNSTNNIGGDSTGSLAETQVKSPYFDMVKVDRRLGQYISKTVMDGDYQAFILTGHAGDGKTSVLVQILKELKLIAPGEGLHQQKDYDHFFYVKDMSEVAEMDQPSILKKALEAPLAGKSSLLISNTGPLLKSFVKLVEQQRVIEGTELGEEDRILLQSKLLTQLDENSDSVIEVEGYRFVLVNIARVDNVSFAPIILEKIVSQELWGACDQCACKDRCPIKNNVSTIRNQFERVAAFVESYYRYLYENDRRMTIRQMVGHLSFAITGNLTCEEVGKKFFKEPFFNFNFANLFFGFIGTSETKNGSQIKGIAQIKLLGLDQKALDVDYKLFVNSDYSEFSNDIRPLLEELKTKHRRHYQIDDEDASGGADEQYEDAKFRRTVRRFYLVYGGAGNENNIFDQVYGNCFSTYVKLIREKQPKAVKRSIQNLMFRALYMKNTGFLPKGTEELPLTLRREDSVFQNVMLVLGSLPKTELNVEQKAIINRLEDVESKQSLYLRVKNEEFTLSLPMLNYFNELVEGSISSNCNPALTHGIARLDTLLLEQFGVEQAEDEDDECEMRVLINTTSGQEIKAFEFESGRMSVIS